MISGVMKVVGFGTQKKWVRAFREVFVNLIPFKSQSSYLEGRDIAIVLDRSRQFDTSSRVSGAWVNGRGLDGADVALQRIQRRG